MEFKFDPERVHGMLMRAGWLPRNSQHDDLSRWSRHRNLLPSLRAIWNEHSTDRSAIARRRWLEAACTRRQRLEYVACSDGERFLWWPDGPVMGSLTGIVSSRPARRWYQDSCWLVSFRRVVQDLDRRRDVLLSSMGTTCHRLMEHVSRVDRFPLVSIQTSGRLGIDEWLKRLDQLPSSGSGWTASVFVSPIVGAPPGFQPNEFQPNEFQPNEFQPNKFQPNKFQPNGFNVPEPDRLVFDLADRVIVLSVRAGGNVSRLLSSHEQNRRGKPLIVIAQPGKESMDGRSRDKAAACRAKQPHTRPTDLTVGGDRPGNSSPAIGRRSAVGEQFLCHWTRACAGPWPDEPLDQYFDELLAAGREDRLAVTALRRICTMQRLLATRRWNRANTPVVALTRRSLADFPRLRVYRPHLGRWDFEPYGICIDFAWLRHRGARPVVYGDEGDWRRLSPASQPFFQPRSTRAPAERRIDWRLEHEWRHVGDIDLRDLPPCKGLVFVPHREAVAELAPFSRWRVVRLADEL